MGNVLKDFAVRLRNKDYTPLMLGGMGVNISTDKLALAVERLGGIAHVSDALLMDVTDRQYGTHFSLDKVRKFKSLISNPDKTAVKFDLDALAESTKTYVSGVMSQARGTGLIFMNCMEKLTMNESLETLKTRLNATLDAGIDGITLAAGLHLQSFKLMADNARFRDALLGTIVSSSRALNLFLKRAASVGRMPDYIVVEGPLAGGHLGFGDDWANYSLEKIVREVKDFLAASNLNIPVFAAGGIFTGGDATHFVRDVGADGVQVATRFTIAQESGLPDEVKQNYINARPEDVEVNHASPTGYPMRMLKSSPALASDVRPNCEAYGYLLNHGECSYLKEWNERHGENRQCASACGDHSKCCLCTHMRNFKVWTCGDSVSRLKETTVQMADGKWYIPPAEHIFHDYTTSEGSEIQLPQGVLPAAA